MWPEFAQKNDLMHYMREFGPGVDLVRHVHGKAALGPGKAHEEVAKGEEPVGRVMQPEHAIELGALTGGVGLGVR